MVEGVVAPGSAAMYVDVQLTATFSQPLATELLPEASVWLVTVRLLANAKAPPARVVATTPAAAMRLSFIECLLVSSWVHTQGRRFRHSLPASQATNSAGRIYVSPYTGPLPLRAGR